MEAYFDHPNHGAAVACDSNEAKKLVALGFVLRDPQPEGARVPDWLKTAKPEPVAAQSFVENEPDEPAALEPVEQIQEPAPKRRGRPKKA